MDIKKVDRLITKKKFDPLWYIMSISLIIGMLIGIYFSTREIVIIHSDFYEKIPEERVAKLVREEAVVDQNEIKKEKKSVRAMRGGGGDPRLRATQKGVLGIINNQIKAKSVASADIFGAGGFAADIDEILSGVDNSKSNDLSSSMRYGYGIGYGSGFAGDINEISSVVNDLKSNNLSGSIRNGEYGIVLKSGESSDFIGGEDNTPEITYSPNNYENANNQINEEENPFIYTAAEPTSTFSIDVDNASYNNILHHVSLNILPPPSSIRIEEMINNFSYNYPVPTGSHPLSVTTEVSSCPWDGAHRILRIGIKGRRLPPEGPPPSNFVFLIDVSGSMASAGKLTLFKQGLRSFISSLHNQDRISIITYAGEAGLHLNSTPGNKTDVITDAIDRLKAGGSTAGSEGIQLAYRLANRNFIPNGNNRIVLVTDGNFNVGESNQSDLVNLIQKKRGNGIFLTVISMNVDNDEDEKTMEQLANNGDGNFNSVFNADELMRVFDEMNATFFTVAKDVKIQVKFEPDQVEAYRLIGYENRMLQNSDFTDDTRDAGEIGAEQTVTALYETVTSNRRKHSNILCNVNIRYKKGDENTSKLMTSEVFDHNKQIEMSTSDYRFATAVAGLGLLLSNSSYKGNLTYDAVIDLARSAANGPYSSQRYGFVDLANKCKSIAQREAVSLR